MNEIKYSTMVQEAETWSKYLNEIIGMLCLTLGLSVARSASPLLYGSICLFCVTILVISNYDKAPTFNLLAEKRYKKELSEVEELALKDFFKKLKQRRTLSYTGYGFLCIVTTGEILFSKWPKILELMYG